MERPERPIVHLHIPKTAGTALRSAFQRSFKDGLRIFPHYDERRYRDVDFTQYDFYSGHIGFTTAEQIGGDIVSVFRNPVDRFISVYYFWRQLFENGVEQSRNTVLASTYSLDQFVQIHDEPFLVEEFFNRMTWQIAHGSQLSQRQELRNEGRTDDDVFHAALANVDKFAVVGVQERLDDFARKIQERFGVAVTIRGENVTKNRASPTEVSVRTLRMIHEWITMDIELYQYILKIA